jgi:kanamycin kinase
MLGGQSTGLPDTPNELSQLIEGYTQNRYPYYETAAKIFRLESKEDVLYLKLIEGQESLNLKRESRILEWINGRIPVPKLLYYSYVGGVEYQLTSEIKGTPTYKAKPNERAEAVNAMGKALRMIHSLDPTGCPIDNRIDIRFAKAIEESKSVENLCERPDETLVFTHGDYCLPNIITQNRKLSGVIDWDYGGLADAYIDIAACAWSIGYNYGEKEAEEKWIPLLFESYGTERDEEKYNYYGKLWQLDF